MPRPFAPPSGRPPRSARRRARWAAARAAMQLANQAAAAVSWLALGSPTNATQARAALSRLAVLRLSSAQRQAAAGFLVPARPTPAGVCRISVAEGRPSLLCYLFLMTPRTIIGFLAFDVTPRSLCSSSPRGFRCLLSGRWFPLPRGYRTVGFHDFRGTTDSYVPIAGQLLVSLCGRAIPHSWTTPRLVGLSLGPRS